MSTRFTNLHSGLLPILGLAALINFQITPTLAQVLFGSMVGSILDSSGAAVPNAAVRVTQLETNESRETQTNESGGFNLSTLKAGTYKVAILKEGFKTFYVENVAVSLNTTVRVDAKLEIGAQSRSVDITAESTLLQTERADVHSEFSAKTIVDLPQPTRTFMGVLALAPGVTPPGASGGGNNNPGKSMAIRANGTSSAGTNVRIDGVTDTNPWVQSNQSYVPSMEAIQTVNMTTASPDAEQGLGNGAAINVQTKSGTNQLHGSLYEYHISSAFKARPFFLAANQGIPKLIENDLGGSLGGRIIKDKLFFFGSYEGDFISQAAANNNTVPLTAMRQGNFTGTNAVLYDPTTGNPDGTGRQLFAADPSRNCAAGKCIPASRINPAVAKLLPLFPDPNQLINGNPNASNHYITTPVKNRLHRLDAKMDYNATSKLKFAGRFGWQPYIIDQQTSLGEVLGGSNFRFQNGTVWAGALNVTYVASPNLVIDGNWGFTRGNQFLVPPSVDQKLGSSFLGIPGVNLNPLPVGGGLPNFNISGYTTLGYAYSYYHYNDPINQYTANTTWIKGSHNIRFGYDMSRQHMNHQETRPDGFTFSGGATSLAASAGVPASATTQFNNFADFLLGLENSYQNSQLLNEFVTLRTWQHSLYIRDQWQVNRKLTLSYGTRWEYYPIPTRADRGIEYFDLNAFRVNLCGVGGNAGDCDISTSKKLFSPRFGIAWRPNERTVIRVGASLTPEQINVYRDGLYSYPARLDYAQSGATTYTPVANLSAGIPVPALPSLTSGNLAIPAGVDFSFQGAALPKDFKRGYTESWNFTIQRDLGHRWNAQVGYVGTHTVKQHTRYDINFSQVGGGNASRPFFSRGISGTFAEILPFGSLKYHSLQSTLQRRFSNGFNIDASYTFSKWTGLCCDDNGDTNGGPAIKIPQYILLDRSLLNQDRTHIFRMSGTYELPFGPGKAMFKTGPLGYVIGGWQLNSILSIYSGTPFSVSASANSLNAPGNSQRADQIKSDVAIYGTANTGLYFDPTAFAGVNTARFGTAGFNSLRGPGVKNIDLSLFRSFRIKEKLSAQLRAEALNLTNTPHFSNPAANVSNAGYGSITGTSAPSRLFDERFLRLGLRISF